MRVHLNFKSRNFLISHKHFAYFFILNIKNINLYLWVNVVNEGTFEF